MIKVSDTAKIKISQLMSEDGFSVVQDYVRVGVKSGGCSGLSYELDFNKQKKENDQLYEDNDVKIIVDKKSFFTLLEPHLNIAVVSMVKALFLIIQTQIEPVVVVKVFLYKF